jgi:hypothetical protein
MEELLYKCYYESCLKCYKTKYNLRRHINSNHLSIKEFECIVCYKTFASKQNLKGHERLHKQKVFMPTFEIPQVMKCFSNSKSAEVQDLILSKIYKDPKVSYSVSVNCNKALLPILPPIALERACEKANVKLPVIPILL